LIKGNFDETLSSQISKLAVVDFAFVDGNHRQKPTLNYFNQLLEKANENSIFIFDDIHWSNEMEEAWKEIQQHPSVTLSIDLFFIGIVFFRKEQKVPQHFLIRF
jgi:predicted O-methyltransferase YrrM